jgi:hypothetical protein
MDERNTLPFDRRHVSGGYLLGFFGFVLFWLPHEVLLLLIEVEDSFGFDRLSSEGRCFLLEHGTLVERIQQIAGIFNFLILEIIVLGDDFLERTHQNRIIRIVPLAFRPK